MRKKDKVLMSKIAKSSVAGKDTAAIAKELGIHPETVRRYKRDKTYDSLANDLLDAYNGDIKTLFKLVMDKSIEVLEGGGKEAMSLNKSLANTMLSRVLTTKRSESEEQADTIDTDKQALIDRLTSPGGVSSILDSPLGRDCLKTGQATDTENGDPALNG